MDNVRDRKTRVIDNASADFAKRECLEHDPRYQCSCPPQYRAKRVDITVQNEGSIFTLTGRTDAGREWIEEHCQEGDYNPFGHGARLVEARYIDPIIDGAGHDGLRVEVR